MRIPYVLERFHLTHVCHYAHVKWEDVEGIDRRLAKLNCRLCLLTVQHSALKQRVIRDRSSDWREYLKRFGETDDQIVAHYAGQQELLCSLCERSVLDSLIVDTTDAGTDETLRCVLDFWGAV